MRSLRELFGKKKRRYFLGLDRRRELKYDRESFAIIEQLTGAKDISSLLAIDTEKIPVLAWAGLIWEDPGPSKEQVREWIEKDIGSEDRLGKLFLFIKEAMNYYADKALGKKNLFSTKNPEYQE